MSNIDELFKHASSTKRKLEPVRHADELYKSTRVSANGDAKTNGRKAMIEDQEDQDDILAGPDMPPEDAEEPDDAEGRFFGGGITSDTKDVLDFIDERDKNDLEPQKIDQAWLRKLALNFEKKISKNTELRAKFEDSPQKFMSSEADLDADIKTLSILSDHPELYEDFAKLGCVASLVSLLAHENTDIAIDAVEIINELTDEDVEAEQEQWDLLVNAMLEADLLNLLYDNISRMNEELDSDRAGIYYVLSVLENLSSRPSIAASFEQDTKLISWLLTRVQKREPSVTQNKQYSAEVLAIYLQSSQTRRTTFTTLNGIDSCLQLLSPYRKRDPIKGTEEEEYMENIFNCITCSVDDGEGKTKFMEAEGIELCIIMVREGKMSRPRALRVLDHALAGPDGGACCEKLVEAAGLKPIFSLFMKKQDNEATEHLLGMLSSMLRSLPADQPSRIRLLPKFAEKDYQVIDRVLQIREGVTSKVALVDKEIQVEKDDMQSDEQDIKAEEWLSRRLDAGLYVLQTVDVILAWLVAEDDGAKRKIETRLLERNDSLRNVKSTLQEQLDGINTSSQNEDSMLKDMLEALIQFV